MDFRKTRVCFRGCKEHVRGSQGVLVGFRSVSKGFRGLFFILYEEF